ncbi:uncharacterized protein LOC116301594 [Actinia tenebrosa]|uniref:Uncharacterized protein LOC116301594 n=1 Tax=Actinia tenebrosa TaxID=6105 RepID=A0A6P8IJ73_ACTTE|nr:uncharacterized protein LOC116301594 [Actinia tenebrosa]XP_031566539.1 uncharacterized protein LOC116301594 [Actinia tenebrosa]
MEIREHKEPGSGPDNPITNCKSLKESDSQAKSGVYWMKFNETSSAPFQVFCDMTTDGGGWTLVYSYTFTKYDYFSHSDNAVTPIPTWPLDFSAYRFVPRSNTTPINESSHSAIDFALWKKIGSEFLIAPNIINWYACKEGTGSFVNWQPGTLTCREVKNLIPPRSPNCALRAPNSISLSACGVLMKSSSSSKMINLNGRVDGCYPVHDSCGTGTTTTDHLRNIPNPGGKLYIR